MLLQTSHSPALSPSCASIIGERITLEPLQLDHFSKLLLLAQDTRIWEHFPESRANSDQHLDHLLDALRLRDLGEHLPFVIRIKATGEIAGYTRLHSWDKQHRKVETGSWLHPNYWRSGVNTESKYLLLRYCFEHLGIMRVQFKTAPNNLRSRAALEKLGATYEGLLRNDRILPNGNCRDTVVYSIISEEWTGVQEHLLSRMAITYAPASQSPAAAYRLPIPCPRPGSAPDEMPGLRVHRH
ncbi:MAG: GNAT family N-acetyltransferase [Lewinellaceae bacterium]|nr:GNAT family N-acetyltransferase [Lewinellaceae bacterium]